MKILTLCREDFVRSFVVVGRILTSSNVIHHHHHHGHHHVVVTTVLVHHSHHEHGHHHVTLARLLVTHHHHHDHRHHIAFPVLLVHHHDHHHHHGRVHSLCGLSRRRSAAELGLRDTDHGEEDEGRDRDHRLHVDKDGRLARVLVLLEDDSPCQ